MFSHAISVNSEDVQLFREKERNRAKENRIRKKQESGTERYIYFFLVKFSETACSIQRWKSSRNNMKLFCVDSISLKRLKAARENVTGQLIARCCLFC